MHHLLTIFTRDSCLEEPTVHRSTNVSGSLSPERAAVSALRVGEVRLQEHVLVDASHQAVDVRGDLLVALHQGQHDAQGLLSVARQVPPTHKKNNNKVRRAVN